MIDLVYIAFFLFFFFLKKKVQGLLHFLEGHPQGWFRGDQ